MISNALIIVILFMHFSVFCMDDQISKQFIPPSLDLRATRGSPPPPPPYSSPRRHTAIGSSPLAQGSSPRSQAAPPPSPVRILPDVPAEDSSHSESGSHEGSPRKSSFQLGNKPPSPRVRIEVNENTNAIAAVVGGDIFRLTDGVVYGADVNYIRTADTSMTLLHLAAEKSDPRFVVVLCNCGVSVKVYTNDRMSQTPLDLALASGNYEAAAELILRNTPFDARWKIDNSISLFSVLLQTGFREGCKSLAEKLVQEKPEIEAADASEILIFFAARGYAKGVLLMHSQYASILTREDISNALYAVIGAAPIKLTEDYELTLKYLSGWASANSMTHELDDVLCAAITNGNPVVIERLLQFCEKRDKAIERCERLLANQNLSHLRSEAIQKIKAKLEEGSSPRYRTGRLRSSSVGSRGQAQIGSPRERFGAFLALLAASIHSLK